jgi:hypothetical protein
MLNRVTFASLVLLCSAILMGCAGGSKPDPEPQIIRLPGTERTVEVYPTIRSDALLCRPEPLLPADVMTDTQLAAWAEMVKEAGAECRQKLNDIRSLVATWPR